MNCKYPYLTPCLLPKTFFFNSQNNFPESNCLCTLVLIIGYFVLWTYGNKIYYFFVLFRFDLQ